MLDDTSRRVYFGEIKMDCFLYMESNKESRIALPGQVELHNYLDMGKQIVIDYNENKGSTENEDIEGSDVDTSEDSDSTQKQVRGTFNPLATIQNIEIHDDGYAVILFDAINPKGAEVGYKDPYSNEARILRKIGKEGTHFSAHLIIKTEGVNGVYPAVLEDVPRLSKTTINTILSQLNVQIRKYFSSNFEVNSPDGAKENNVPIKRKFRTQVSFIATPSKEFWQILKSEKSICELVLINANVNKFDTNTTLDVRKKELYLETPKPKFYDNPKESMTALATEAIKEKCEQIKVQFKDVDKNQRTVYIEPNSMSLKDDRFTKSKYIKDFTAKLATSHEGINVEVVSKMKSLL